MNWRRFDGRAQSANCSTETTMKQKNATMQPRPVTSDELAHKPCEIVGKYSVPRHLPREEIACCGRASVKLALVLMLHQGWNFYCFTINNALLATFWRVNSSYRRHVIVLKSHAL